MISSVSKKDFLSPKIGGTLRSGVIPYATIDGHIYWLMGSYKDGRGGNILSDFGGGCKISRGEQSVTCLLREVDEESSGLLTPIIEDAIQSSDKLTIFRAQSRNPKSPPNYRYLIFVEIPYLDYAKDFRPNEELDDMLWVPQAMIASSRMNYRLLHEPLRAYIRHMKLKGSWIR